MKNAVIAKRYARALCEIAIERDILDRVADEVNSFDESLHTNAGLRLFLVSQDISKKQKKSKLEKVFQDRVSNVFFNFLLVLLKKNREAIFSDVAREFRGLEDAYRKRTYASAVTALPMDESSMGKLKSILDSAFNLDVQIKNQVDESILGGIIVNIKGQLLDGSLRSQLHRLQSQLVDNTNTN